jgi:hypothetical protein
MVEIFDVTTDDALIFDCISDSEGIEALLLCFLFLE